jgi:cytochrome c553
MAPFAANLSDADMADLAAYYAAQRPRSRPAAVEAARVAAGKEAAARHHCTSCHRPDLSGQQQVPRLAGQDLEYLRRLLRGFKDRTASDLDGTMTMAAQPLTVEEVEALAQFLASLQP